MESSGAKRAQNKGNDQLSEAEEPEPVENSRM